MFYTWPVVAVEARVVIPHHLQVQAEALPAHLIVQVTPGERAVQCLGGLR